MTDVPLRRKMDPPPLRQRRDKEADTSGNPEAPSPFASFAVRKHIGAHKLYIRVMDTGTLAPLSRAE